MSEDSISKAPRTEMYQAQRPGFWGGKIWEKGNLKEFVEGEDVPFYFKPVNEILSTPTGPPKADRPTMKDAGIEKPKVTPQDAPPPSSEGRITAAEAGMPKAKPTPITTTTGTDAPTTEVEVKPEKKKVKKKAKKKAKRKAVKKKAKK